MVAVIGDLPMKNGYMAYSIAYFAKRRPHPRELAATWLEEAYVWGPENAPIIKYDDDPWDFDLVPWLEKGSLRWCLPGWRNKRLAPYPPVDGDPPCPYVDLRGRRQRMQLVRNEYSVRDTPKAVRPYYHHEGGW